MAFEALLLPDGTQELSYRASLRIARLVGRDQTTRKMSFEQAKSSYNIRSKVVHGDKVNPNKLRQTLDQTRSLAREALRSYLLRPPAGGVAGIDDELLA